MQAKQLPLTCNNRHGISFIFFFNLVTVIFQFRTKNLHFHLRSVQSSARVPERGEPEGTAETHAGPEGEPHRRSSLQVGLREQPLEVNLAMVCTVTVHF